MNINHTLTNTFNHKKYILSYYPEHNGSKSIYAVMSNENSNKTHTMYKVYTLIEKTENNPAIGIEDEFTMIKNKNGSIIQTLREKTVKSLTSIDEKDFKNVINVLKNATMNKNNIIKKKIKNNSKNNSKTKIKNKTKSITKSITKSKNKTKSKKTKTKVIKKRPRNTKKGGYISNCGDPVLAKYDCIKPQWSTSCM